MNVIDFHPDELLDRSLRGELSSDERAHLDQHLAQCATCRFEQLLRDDFAAEASHHEEADALHALVSGALLAADQPSGRTASPAALAAAVCSGRKSRTPVWMLLVAATLLLLSGVAAAQIGLLEQAVEYVRARAPQLVGASLARGLRRRQTHDESTAQKAQRTGQSVAGGGAALDGSEQSTAATAPFPAAQSGSSRAPHGAAASSASPRQSAAGLAPPRPRGATGTLRLHARVDATRATRATRAEPTATTPDDARYTDSPELLFERANSLRRQGRPSEAMALYRELGLRFAQHPEGRLALALLARLELDQADPAAALREFEAYLATGDQALNEQALAGRALALGQLGRLRAQCAAFEALLRAYPSSSYAQLARQRCPRLE